MRPPSCHSRCFRIIYVGQMRQKTLSSRGLCCHAAGDPRIDTRCAMDKPSVFVGSSSEGLHIAEAIYAHLSYETKPKLWTHQLFLPGQYPMEVLERQLRQHAFAVLVASPDDQLIRRDMSSPAMRDNLLLEFGLFAGALGRKRAFFVCPSEPQVQLPSDLFGVIVATYDGARAGAGPDEVAAAVQVPCQQIRIVIAEEWKLICTDREKAAARIRSTERGKAVERLHDVVVQLRDAVMAVQRDAFAAVSDETSFGQVRHLAVTKVQEIAKSFDKDAQLIQVDGEVNALAQVTCDALDDLPFPRELSLERGSIRRKTIDTGLGALSAFLGGRDPLEHVQNVASDEAQMRVSALKERYMEWWDRHYPIIQQATARLQDRLFQSALELYSIEKTT